MDWFASDPHISHDNIIRHCSRPFNSIKEMNDTIIKNWNKKVKDSDTVFLLGDLIWDKEKDDGKRLKNIKHLLDSLKGDIILIVGDHDHCSLEYRKRYKFICDFHRYKIDRKMEISLFHWPIARWAKSHYGCWHLYGHHHGTFQNQGKSFDIGMDVNNFTPLSLDDVIKYMKSRPDNVNLIKKRPKNGELEQIEMNLVY